MVIAERQIGLSTSPVIGHLQAVALLAAGSIAD